MNDSAPVNASPAETPAAENRRHTRARWAPSVPRREMPLMDDAGVLELGDELLVARAQEVVLAAPDPEQPEFCIRAGGVGEHGFADRLLRRHPR